MAKVLCVMFVMCMARGEAQGSAAASLPVAQPLPAAAGPTPGGGARAAWGAASAAAAALLLLAAPAAVAPLSVPTGGALAAGSGRAAARRGGALRALLAAALLLGAGAQTCAVAIPQTTGAATDYGVFPTSGAQEFCTNVLPAQYENGALQLSRHQAAPGHFLTLTVTAWATENSNSDFGVVYAGDANISATTSSSCVLTGGTTMFGPYAGTIFSGLARQSNYGAQIGLCFYSDSTGPANGIAYTISTTACPAGFYCPANSAHQIACAAVRLHAPVPSTAACFRPLSLTYPPPPRSLSHTLLHHFAGHVQRGWRGILQHVRSWLFRRNRTSWKHRIVHQLRWRCVTRGRVFSPAAQQPFSLPPY